MIVINIEMEKPDYCKECKFHIGNYCLLKEKLIIYDDILVNDCPIEDVDNDKLVR